MASLKKNATYNAAYRVLRLIFPIITFPYVSRILGPTGIGQVTFANAIARYFATVSLLGIPIYGTREISKSRAIPGETEKVFSALLIISTFLSWLALGVYLLLPLFAPFLAPDPRLFWIFATIILVNPGHMDWYFQGLEDYRYVTIRKFVVKIAGLFMTFVLIRSPEHYVRYGGIWAMTVILASLVNIYSSLRETRFQFREIGLRHHLLAILPSAALSFSTKLYASIDTMMLGAMISDDRYSVGLYSAAGKTVRIALSLIVAVGAVAAPRVALKHAAGDEDSARRVISRSLEFSVFFGIPMVIGLFILAPDIIRIFAGKEFVPAVQTLKILAPEIVIMSLSTVMSTQILYSRGKEKLVLITSIIGLMSAVIFNYLLIPQFHHNGAAVATVITHSVLFTIFLILSWRYVRPALFSKTIVFILLVNIGLVAVVLAVSEMLQLAIPVVRVTLITGASVLYYMLASLFLRITPARNMLKWILKGR